MYVLIIMALCAITLLEEGITLGEPLGIVLGTIFAIVTIALWREATQ